MADTLHDLAARHAAANTRTLRDEFAMAALTGMLAGRPGRESLDPNDWADGAYAVADSMMAARK